MQEAQRLTHSITGGNDTEEAKKHGTSSASRYYIVHYAASDAPSPLFFLLSLQEHDLLD